MLFRSASGAIGLSCLILAPLVALPPLIQDHQFLVAAKKADGQKIIAVTESWPRDTKRFIMTESGLTNGGYDALAKKVILKGLEHNPNSFALWKALNGNKLSTPVEVARALTELRRIDPRSESPK